MKFLPFLLALAVIVSCTNHLYSQGYAPAVAYPLTGITIDGDLSDWPQDLHNYPITHLAFGTVTGPDDLSSSFQIGYDPAENYLYLGLTVKDDMIVSQSADGIIDEIDNVLLYLDDVHNPVGGGRQLFIAGGNLRDTGGLPPPAWAPYILAMSWEDILLEIRSKAGVIIYEWRISPKRQLKPGTVLGFDLIVADVDPEAEEASWMTWRQGTGKSEGAQRLGEVILAANPEEMGRISGKVARISDRIPPVDFVIIKSQHNPAFWLKLPVDSLGNYDANLPKGKYIITPEREITSPIYSDGFYLEPLRISSRSMVNVEVTPDRLCIPATLELSAFPPPGGLFEAEGVLLRSDFDAYRVDEFVRGFQAYFGIPGISLALVKDGEVVYDKVFGVKNELTQEPLDKNSLFEAASISKAVFSLIVLKLVEDDRLDLDKPLYEYLRFPNIEHDERYKQITARHVLNHQTGLTNWPVASYTGFLSDQKADLVFAPGSGFEYSGEAMNYLGRVVEKILGKSLSAHFLENTAPALGLTATRFAYQDEMAAEIAVGHWHGYPRFKNKFAGVDSPASGVMSNAHDFSNFLTSLLEKKYLSETSYQLITTPHQEIIEEKRLFDKDLPQALCHGFFSTEGENGQTIAHGGNNGDFDCKFVLLPEKKAGYVVFTNSNLGDEFIRLLELFLLVGEDAYLTEFGHHD